MNGLDRDKWPSHPYNFIFTTILVLLRQLCRLELLLCASSIKDLRSSSIFLDVVSLSLPIASSATVHQLYLHRHFYKLIRPKPLLSRRRANLPGARLRLPENLFVTYFYIFNLYKMRRSRIATFTHYSRSKGIRDKERSVPYRISAVSPSMEIVDIHSSMVKVPTLSLQDP